MCRLPWDLLGGNLYWLPEKGEFGPHITNQRNQKFHISWSVFIFQIIKKMFENGAVAKPSPGMTPTFVCLAPEKDEKWKTTGSVFRANLLVSYIDWKNAYLISQLFAKLSAKILL